jgi:hypothetical protein
MSTEKIIAKLPAETQAMFKRAEQAVIDAIMVPSEWLPEAYRGKRSERKLSSVVKQAKRKRKNLFKEPREISVKFDSDRKVTSATPERLAILERYADCIERGVEIDYDVNEDKLYRANLEFAGAAMKAGWFGEEEENREEEETWVYENDL